MAEVGAQAVENKPGGCGVCSLQQCHPWHLQDRVSFVGTGVVLIPTPTPKSRISLGRNRRLPGHREGVCGF